MIEKLEVDRLEFSREATRSCTVYEAKGRPHVTGSWAKVALAKARTMALPDRVLIERGSGDI